MDTIRFLHASDLHLGAECSALGSLAGQRREELYRALETCVGICRKESLDFFLIPGDVFDTDAPDESLVRRVKALFASLEGTEVLIAPGNHDYISARSPYLGEWSSNVHIFLPEGSVFRFPEKETAIYGVGFSASYEKEPLLGRISVDPQDKFRLGVLHGDLTGTGAYNPITEADLRESGLQYVALGHIHQHSGFLQAENTLYAYSGCPEGSGFDETGPRGVCVGCVEKGKVRVEFRTICRRMYLRETVDVTGISGVEELEKAVKETLRERFGETFSQHFYKVLLRGECRLTGEDLQAAQLRLGETLHFCQLRDETLPQGHLQQLAQETSLKGIFVRQMLEKEKLAGTEKEKQLCRQALRLGLKAFEGGVTDFAD